MIVSRLNLVCRAGHLHYAPPRELPEWIGHECLHGATMTASGKPTQGRCREPLMPATLPPRWWVQRSTSPTISAPSATPTVQTAA